MSLDVSLNKVVTEKHSVFEANITHNLASMAAAAGIYKHLWRPEELGITKAGELTAGLEEGLQRLLAEPDKYKAFNPSNGWGTYENLVFFVCNYINACRKNPDADVEVSR